MAFDIFICCDKRDHRRVLSIVQDLRNRGYDVCYDRDDSITGKNWEETISSTLQGVSIILLFLSSRSVNDPQVLWVANYARDYDIPIIDVQIEKIKQDEDIRSFPYAEDILDLRNYKTYGEFVVAIRPALKKAGVVHGEATAVKDMTPPITITGIFG